MNIFVVIKENPFRKSSASANRWISLLEGLQNFDVNLYILIYGGYLSRKEKDEMGMTGHIQKKPFGPVSADDGIRVMKIIEAAMISNQDKKRINV